jgi:FkbM family methyltransferase
MTAKVGILGKVFRCLPPQLRGKARLARLLLRKSAAAPALIQDRNGYWIWLPNLREPVAFNLWMDGVYEPDVMSFLKSSVNPGSVLVDVGANIGAFAVPMAGLLDQGGRVIAVEASPRIASILQLNVERNRLTNVSVVACAASDGESASVPFYEAPWDHFGMGSTAPQFGVPPVQVAAKPLDQILEDQGVAEVAALKIDVEGYEAHVLLGAQRLLRSPVPRIVFEFCDWAEERAFPGKAGWAQEILLNSGYELWRLSAFQSNGKPLHEPVRKGSDSIVAIPRAIIEQ